MTDYHLEPRSDEYRIAYLERTVRYLEAKAAEYRDERNQLRRLLDGQIISQETPDSLGR